ncbi:hypothetical protein EON63_17265 [archaeon]|nr:MAG: hypothetical protein EON63_17265 [archaeon]
MGYIFLLMCMYSAYASLILHTILTIQVLRICAAMDEMMDETKEEGATPGRATGKGGNSR